MGRVCWGSYVPGGSEGPLGHRCWVELRIESLLLVSEGDGLGDTLILDFHIKNCDTKNVWF